MEDLGSNRWHSSTVKVRVADFGGLPEIDIRRTLVPHWPIPLFLARTPPPSQTDRPHERIGSLYRSIKPHFLGCRSTVRVAEAISPIIFYYFSRRHSPWQVYQRLILMHSIGKVPFFSALLDSIAENPRHCVLKSGLKWMTADSKVWLRVHITRSQFKTTLQRRSKKRTPDLPLEILDEGESEVVKLVVHAARGKSGVML
jgi:hypothetical protein